MKVRYGLRTMIEISTHESSSGILQKEISATQEIPIKFLDSIISSLRNSGLIINYSGKRSGYVLAKHPTKISVYDVYRAFEPELALVDCSERGNICNLIDSCYAKDYWLELNNEIINKMKSSNLDLLVKRKKYPLNTN
ncbi:MAG: Rrf2 family transcriptional regulator [Bacteroidota bacterium]